MISIPRKGTDEVDWTTPIRNAIAQSYGEDPDNYASECAALQRCRQDAVRGAGSDITGMTCDVVERMSSLTINQLAISCTNISGSWNYSSCVFQRFELTSHGATRLRSRQSSSPLWRTRRPRSSSISPPHSPPLPHPRVVQTRKASNEHSLTSAVAPGCSRISTRTSSMHLPPT